MRPFVGSETTMLAVVGFQPGEVSFQPIGRGRDARIVKVVKHVREGVLEHAPGTLYVAEDPSGLLPGAYAGTVLFLPGRDQIEKSVSLYRCGDPGDAEEDPPQLACVDGLGGAPAPCQPLPLDMDKAALDDHIRPEHPEYPDHLRVTVHSEAKWVQAFVHHRFEERTQLRTGVLANTELSPHQAVSLCVHQDDDAVRAVKKCPVEEKMPGNLKIQGRLWGRIDEVAFDQAPHLPLAVPALQSQLAYRISLHYPPAEPCHLPQAAGSGIAPVERAPASAAEPPLPAVRIAAVPMGAAPTLRAAFLGDMTP